MLSPNDLKKLKRIIHDKSGIAEGYIKPESNLRTDLGMDDLDTIELVMEVERDFNISIPDEAVEKFLKVEDVLNFVDAADRGKKGI